MADAKVDVTQRHNDKAISHFRLKAVSACLILISNLVNCFLAFLIFSLFLFHGRATKRGMVLVAIGCMPILKSLWMSFQVPRFEALKGDSLAE